MNILDFYEERIKHFDDERQLFHEYINLVHISKKEKHMLDWNNRQMHSDMREAKEELDRAKKHLLRLNDDLQHRTIELEEVKNSQVNRKKQIQLLSELSCPVEHDFTYVFEDRFKLAAQTAARPKEAVEGKKFRSGEVIRLEQKLAETGKAVEHKIHKILENSTVSEYELKQGYDELIDDVIEARVATDSLITTVNKCDEQSFASVAELLRLRLKITVAQREEFEEIVNLQKDKDRFARREQDVRQRIIDESRNTKKRLKAELDQTNKEFQKQLKEIDDRIAKAKVVEEKVEKRHSEMATHSGNALESHLLLSRKRYKELKRRHALEMEGYSQEAKFLRQRMKSIEKQIIKEHNNKGSAVLRKY